MSVFPKGNSVLVNEGKKERKKAKRNEWKNKRDKRGEECEIKNKFGKWESVRFIQRKVEKWKGKMQERKQTSKEGEEKDKR